MINSKKIIKAFFVIPLLGFSLSCFSDVITLNDHNGVYMVPITLNEAITVNGILDTGSYEMFIPFDIIESLKKSASPATEDISEDVFYRLADGSIKITERINIEKIKIGETIFHNISAIVGPNNSEILIGQSLLQEFNYYSVDNKRKILILNNNQ
jgi:predicted aspartyl protease